VSWCEGKSWVWRGESPLLLPGCSAAVGQGLADRDGGAPFADIVAAAERACRSDETGHTAARPRDEDAGTWAEAHESATFKDDGGLGDGALLRKEGHGRGLGDCTVVEGPRLVCWPRHRGHRPLVAVAGHVSRASISCAGSSNGRVPVVR
jgi:hypothetical protein